MDAVVDDDEKSFDAEMLEIYESISFIHSFVIVYHLSDRGHGY